MPVVFSIKSDKTDETGETTEQSFEISPLSVGYGFHEAWIFSAMFGTQALFGIDAGPVIVGDFAPSLFLVISMLVNAVSLIVLGATIYGALDRIFTHRLVVFASTLTALGTAIIFLCRSTMPFSLAAAIIGGVATGIGSAILLIVWGTVFSRLDNNSVIINVSLAVLVAAAVYALTRFIGYPGGGIIASLLPLGELAIVWNYTPAAYSRRHEVPIFMPLPMRRSKFVALFSAPLLLLGVALGFLRQMSMWRLVDQLDPGAIAPFLLLSGVIVAIVLVVVMLIVGAERFDDYARPVYALIAIVMVVMPFAFTSESNPVVSILVCAAYFLFEALMWITLCGFSQRFRLSTCLIFGIGRGALALGSALGLFGSTLLRLTSATTLYGMVVPFLPIALACLAVGMLFLPHRHDIANAMPSVAAWDAETGERSDEDEESPATPSDGTVPGQNAPAENVPEVAAAQTESAPSDGLRSHASSAVRTEHGGKAPSTVSDSAGTETADQGSGNRGGYYRRKCEIIANRYLLSKRESEILFYLGKGFNASYLEEKLFISEGTAKTHIRHIYRKTDVHSQQELMRMINDIRI